MSGRSPRSKISPRPTPIDAMIALGVWQLQRAGEKERLLAQYARAASLPALDLDPLIEPGQVVEPVMGRSDRIVSEEPEKGRLLGMLRHDVEEHRGHQLSWTEAPLILLTPLDRLET